MKVYNLSCEHQHQFEGWFSSEEDCADQLERQAIECPLCGNCHVVKRPSAPRLSLSGSQQHMPDKQRDMQAALLEFARKLVANTEDVGAGFADEARRIHYNEAPERAIRGTATPDERVALADEGIDVLQLPMPTALKQTLQ